MATSKSSKQLSKPLRLNDTLRDFYAKTQQGDIEFFKFAGESWVMLFSYPADFAPVCASEIALVSQLLPQFEARNCKVLALALDSIEDHFVFIEEIQEVNEVEVAVPIISDPLMELASELGMMNRFEDASTMPRMATRTTLLIDPQKRLRLRMTYPYSTGRNFNEILRALDSLKLVSKHPVKTPANWKVGEEVIIDPELTDEEAKERFPSGFQSVKPSLRLTPQPELQ